jgi:hypothetical protein
MAAYNEALPSNSLSVIIRPSMARYKWGSIECCPLLLHPRCKRQFHIRDSYRVDRSRESHERDSRYPPRGKDIGAGIRLLPKCSHISRSYAGLKLSPQELMSQSPREPPLLSLSLYSVRKPWLTVRKHLVILHVDHCGQTGQDRI